nr:titin homolog isoform X3 [Drosophila suzukii]
MAGEAPAATSPAGCNSSSSNNIRSSSNSNSKETSPDPDPVQQQLNSSVDSGIAVLEAETPTLRRRQRLSQCQRILQVLQRDHLTHQQLRDRLSKLAHKKWKREEKDSSEDHNCNVCCADLDLSSAKNYVTCCTCGKSVCRGPKCADWRPKDAKWECQLCQSSKESLAHTSSWVAEQMSFNQHKFVYPMRARSEVYIPIVGDGNDSSMQFESVSQIGQTASMDERAKIREYVEEIVAEMLGGNLDHIRVGQLSKSENYLQLFDKFHAKLSNLLINVENSLCARALKGDLPAIVNGHNSGNGLGHNNNNNNNNNNADSELADISQTRLRSLIETIIAETLRSTSLSASGAVSEISLDTRSHASGNGLKRRHRTEHYFEPKIYQDLLATAVLNKIADKEGNTRLLAESTPDLSGRHIDENFNAEALSTTSGSSIEPRSDCSLTDHEIGLDNGKSQSLQTDLERESVLSDYIAAHMVPLPDFSASVTESEDDIGSISSGMIGDGNWEDNWLFKKKRSSATPSSIGMLVPAPTENVRAQIGDKTTDEVSDLSEMGSDIEESSLDLLRCNDLNDRLLSKHLIGGQNTKLVLDELVDRTSLTSHTLLEEHEPAFTETTNEFVVSPMAVPSDIKAPSPTPPPPPMIFQDDLLNEEPDHTPIAAQDETEELSSLEGCTGFSTVEYLDEEQMHETVPSVIEILAAMALGPMLAVPASEQPGAMTPSEMHTLKELSDLALAEINARTVDLMHAHSLDIIEEENSEPSDTVSNPQLDILQPPPLAEISIPSPMPLQAEESVVQTEVLPPPPALELVSEYEPPPPMEVVQETVDLPSSAEVVHIGEDTATAGEALETESAESVVNSSENQPVPVDINQETQPVSVDIPPSLQTVTEPHSDLESEEVVLEIKSAVVKTISPIEIDPETQSIVVDLPVPMEIVTEIDHVTIVPELPSDVVHPSESINVVSVDIQNIQVLEIIADDPSNTASLPATIVVNTQSDSLGEEHYPEAQLTAEESTTNVAENDAQEDSFAVTAVPPEPIEIVSVDLPESGKIVLEAQPFVMDIPAPLETLPEAQLFVVDIPESLETDKEMAIAKTIEDEPQIASVPMESVQESVVVEPQSPEEVEPLNESVASQPLENILEEQTDFEPHHVAVDSSPPIEVVSQAECIDVKPSASLDTIPAEVIPPPIEVIELSATEEVLPEPQSVTLDPPVIVEGVLQIESADTEPPEPLEIILRSDPPVLQPPAEVGCLSEFAPTESPASVETQSVVNETSPQTLAEVQLVAISTPLKIIPQEESYTVQQTSLIESIPSVETISELQTPDPVTLNVPEAVEIVPEMQAVTEEQLLTMEKELKLQSIVSDPQSPNDVEPHIESVDVELRSEAQSVVKETSPEMLPEGQFVAITTPVETIPQDESVVVQTSLIESIAPVETISQSQAPEPVTVNAPEPIEIVRDKLAVTEETLSVMEMESQPQSIVSGPPPNEVVSQVEEPLVSAEILIPDVPTEINSETTDPIQQAEIVNLPAPMEIIAETQLAENETPTSSEIVAQGESVALPQLIPESGPIAVDPPSSIDAVPQADPATISSPTTSEIVPESQPATVDPTACNEIVPENIAIEPQPLVEINPETQTIAATISSPTTSEIVPESQPATVDPTACNEIVPENIAIEPQPLVEINPETQTIAATISSPTTSEIVPESQPATVDPTACNEIVPENIAIEPQPLVEINPETQTIEIDIPVPVDVVSESESVTVDQAEIIELISEIESVDGESQVHQENSPERQLPSIVAGQSESVPMEALEPVEIVPEVLATTLDLTVSIKAVEGAPGEIPPMSQSVGEELPTPEENLPVTESLAPLVPEMTIAPQIDLDNVETPVRVEVPTEPVAVESPDPAENVPDIQTATEKSATSDAADSLPVQSEILLAKNHQDVEPVLVEPHTSFDISQNESTSVEPKASMEILSEAESITSVPAPKEVHQESQSVVVDPPEVIDVVSQKEAVEEEHPNRLEIDSEPPTVEPQTAERDVAMDPTAPVEAVLETQLGLVDPKISVEDVLEAISASDSQLIDENSAPADTSDSVIEECSAPAESALEAESLATIEAALESQSLSLDTNNPIEIVSDPTSNAVDPEIALSPSETTTQIESVEVEVPENLESVSAPMEILPEEQLVAEDAGKELLTSFETVSIALETKSDEMDPIDPEVLGFQAAEVAVNVPELAESVQEKHSHNEETLVFEKRFSNVDPPESFDVKPQPTEDIVTQVIPEEAPSSAEIISVTDVCEPIKESITHVETLPEDQTVLVNITDRMETESLVEPLEPPSTITEVTQVKPKEPVEINNKPEEVAVAVETTAPVEIDLVVEPTALTSSTITEVKDEKPTKPIEIIAEPPSVAIESTESPKVVLDSEFVAANSVQVIPGSESDAVELVPQPEAAAGDPQETIETVPPLESIEVDEPTPTQDSSGYKSDTGDVAQADPVGGEPLESVEIIPHVVSVSETKLEKPADADIAPDPEPLAVTINSQDIAVTMEPLKAAVNDIPESAELVPEKEADIEINPETQSAVADCPDSQDVIIETDSVAVIPLKSVEAVPQNEIDVEPIDPVEIVPKVEAVGTEDESEIKPSATTEVDNVKPPASLQIDEAVTQNSPVSVTVVPEAVEPLAAVEVIAQAVSASLEKTVSEEPISQTESIFVDSPQPLNVGPQEDSVPTSPSVPTSFETKPNDLEPQASAKLVPEADSVTVDPTETAQVLSLNGIIVSESQLIDSEHPVQMESLLAEPPASEPLESEPAAPPTPVEIVPEIESITKDTIVPVETDTPVDSIVSVEVLTDTKHVPVLPPVELEESENVAQEEPSAEDNSNAVILEPQTVDMDCTTEVETLTSEEPKSISTNNFQSEGSIAEREVKKWYNAVEMPNNPYAPEALKQRISGTQERFMDVPNISPCAEQKALASALTENPDPPSPKTDYKRYSRDYYINNAPTPTDSTGSGNAAASVAAEDVEDIVINEAQKESNQLQELVYKALPVQVLDESLDSQSNPSLYSLQTTTTTSDESDTVRIYDFNKQETTVIKKAAPVEQQPSTSTTSSMESAQSGPPSSSSIDSSVSKKRERPVVLQFGPGDSAPTIGSPVSTPTRGSTPPAFRFLQPKRRLIDPSQVLSVDEDDVPEPTTPSAEKPAIEDEVVHSMPSVKALAQAFLLTSKHTQPQRRWRAKVRIAAPPDTPDKPDTSLTKRHKLEHAVSMAEVADESTIASDLSSLETDPSIHSEGNPPIASPASPVPVRHGFLRSNIAFFENLKFK